MIGVINIDSTKESLSYISERFYCFLEGKGFNASKGEINDYYESTNYGIVCKNNDIIEMELNMNELFVKYIINGKDYGKAFDVTEGSYRAAVYLYHDGGKLRIV